LELMGMSNSVPPTRDSWRHTSFSTVTPFSEIHERNTVNSADREKSQPPAAPTESVTAASDGGGDVVQQVEDTTTLILGEVEESPVPPSTPNNEPAEDEVEVEESPVPPPTPNNEPAEEGDGDSLPQPFNEAVSEQEAETPFNEAVSEQEPETPFNEAVSEQEAETTFNEAVSEQEPVTPDTAVKEGVQEQMVQPGETDVENSGHIENLNREKSFLTPHLEEEEEEESEYDTDYAASTNPSRTETPMDIKNRENRETEIHEDRNQSFEDVTQQTDKPSKSVELDVDN